MFPVPTNVAALVVRHVELLLADIKDLLVGMLAQHDQLHEPGTAGELLFDDRCYDLYGLRGLDLGLFGLVHIRDTQQEAHLLESTILGADPFEVSLCFYGVIVRDGTPLSIELSHRGLMDPHHLSDVKWDKPYLLLGATYLKAGVAVKGPDWDHLSLQAVKLRLLEYSLAGQKI